VGGGGGAGMQFGHADMTFARLPIPQE
jgi:hypothetical protein